MDEHWAGSTSPARVYRDSTSTITGNSLYILSLWVVGLPIARDLSLIPQHTKNYDNVKNPITRHTEEWIFCIPFVCNGKSTTVEP